jgi:hypothetical protein
MKDVAFIPARDALGHTAPLDYTTRFPLLGLPLEIRSNSAGVIAAAERSFGAWRELPPNLVEPAEALVVDIIVHPADDAVRQSRASYANTHNLSLIQRVHGQTFLATDGAILLSAQMDRGRRSLCDARSGHE